MPAIQSGTRLRVTTAHPFPTSLSPEERPALEKRVRCFADLFCEHEHIGRERFMMELLRRTRYPHTRYIAALLEAAWPALFVADYEFVTEVGGLQRYADYQQAVEGFRWHRANRGWLRRILRVRISIARMNALVKRECLRCVIVMPFEA